jgi:hypothetical protein
MAFLSENSSLYFSKEDAMLEQDEVIFRDRMRKLLLFTNQYAANMTNEQAMKFMEWCATRIHYCERCNLSFNTTELMTQHKCDGYPSDKQLIDVKIPFCKQCMMGFFSYYEIINHRCVESKQ